MTETLAHWNSSDSTQQELSNEYQYDRVQKIFENHCILNCLLDKSSLSIERVKEQAEEKRACLLASSRVYQLIHCCDPDESHTARSGDFMSIWILV